MKYIITAMANVQLISLGVTLMSGQTTTTETLTPELKRAQSLGLIRIEKIQESKPKRTRRFRRSK